MNKTLQRCGLESAQQVQAICSKHFGEGRRGNLADHNPPTPQWKVAKIISMKAEGKTIAQIAAALYTARSTVSYILNGRGAK